MNIFQLVGNSVTLAQLAIAAVAAGTVFLLVVMLFAGRDSRFRRMQSRILAYDRTPNVPLDDTGEQDTKKGTFSVSFLRNLTKHVDKAVRRRGLFETLNSALEQANVPLSPGEALSVASLFTVFAGIGVGALTGSSADGLIAIIVTGVLGTIALRFAAGRERRRFEHQLSNTLTLLSTSLRAGYSLLQALEAVGAEASDPTAREFSRALAEIRLGRNVEDALRGIAARMSSGDFSWAVMAIEIQREVGGNLAEVLQIVADTMRARERLRRDVRALTAEGRLSGLILAGLPFALFLMLWIMNREYLMPLLTYKVGWLALAASGVMMGFGIWWMQRIVNIEI